jgi:hypothetical protein
MFKEGELIRVVSVMVLASIVEMKDSFLPYDLRQPPATFPMPPPSFSTLGVVDSSSE